MILYIYYKYMHCFFDTEGISRTKEISMYFFMLLWLFYSETSVLQPLGGISMLLTIFVLTWIYEGSLKGKFALTLFIYALNSLCKVLTNRVIVFWEMKTGTDMFHEAEIIGMLVLMFVCELLVELAVEHIQRIRVRLAENESAKRQLEGYSNQLSVLKNSEEKVRGLRHDLKHHLNELMILAERDESSEIKEYIKSMDGFMTYSGEYVSSGNTDIDSLLNLMLDAAKKELCDVSCRVCIPSGLDIAPFDLNVILGNLLDNAILAAKQTQEKRLCIKISYKLGMLLINVENSYAGKVIKEGNRYISTKEDSIEHGRGIENVRCIVEKYDGNMEIKDDNNMFRVKIFLYAAAE